MASCIKAWSVVVGVFALSILTLAAPNPVPVDSNVVKSSLNGLCGSENSGSTCIGSGFGNCCSQYGFCGSSPNYCGRGCQSAYGECSPGSTNVSLNGLCGPGVSCLGSAFGNCCSQYGFCGQNLNFCGSGCQSEYGVCGIFNETSTSISIPSSSHSSSFSTSHSSSTPPSHTTTQPSPTSPTSTITPPPNTSFLNCATKTITTTPSTCPPFTETNCATPECIVLSTIHLNCDCPTVGLVFTDTVLRPCSTVCDIGCATDYSTIATPCPTSPPLPTTTTGGGSASSSSTSTIASSTSSGTGECVAKR